MDNDIVIIGGGHNGLVCAYYLAARGVKVRVLERRAVVGGAAVTAEFHPGFRNSTLSYTVSLLGARIIADMDLARHGLRIVGRKVQNFLPLNDRDHLLTGAGRTQSEVAKFSAKDASRLDAFGARLTTLADMVRQILTVTPPNLPDGGGWADFVHEALSALSVGRRVNDLDLTAKRDLLALFGQSAGDLLDTWFESDPVKAVFGFDAVVGNFASPYSAGTAYVLLHHWLGEVNGQKGVWGHAIGGMGAITQAMRAACEEKGVAIETDAAVRRVVVQGGRATGVELSDGRTIAARAVAANVNPKLLFRDLMDAGDLPADFRERMERYRCASGTFRMNVALSALPRFSCLPGEGDHMTAGIIMAPGLRYMDRAYFDARQSGWSKAPIVEMLVPSTLDDTLAPAGAHVASLFCQHVATELPDGRGWDDTRDTVAAHMIDTVDGFAPGFKASVLGYQAFSPLDLERDFGLIGGDIMHGALSLDQLFSARPVLGHGDYRAPVKGLYMCGAGTHPGGGVSGLPGYNAAREILRDARRRRF
jgi:phytoene dehydrogenase-like protein